MPHRPLAPLAALRWAVVAPLVDRVDPASVLEIGCGLGGFGSRLAERASYVGVEADATSAAAARATVAPAGGTVLHGSVDDLPADDTFDLVCAFEVLEHQEDDAAALQAWAARAAPDGWVLLSVPADPDRYGAWDEMVGHYRRYTAAALTDVAHRAGLTEVTTRHYGWPLGYATEPVRNAIARRRRAARAPASMAAATESSGRQYQPHRAWAGAAIASATAPFAWAQARRPDRGVGLVAVGRVGG